MSRIKQECPACRNARHGIKTRLMVQHTCNESERFKEKYDIEALFEKACNYGISFLNVKELMALILEDKIVRCNCKCHKGNNITHVTPCCEKGFMLNN